MSEWQPIDSAPRDGTVFLAYWRDMPHFVAWCPQYGSVRTVGALWWKRREFHGEEAGFRVLMPPRPRMAWGIHGNYAPFTPTHWQPLPDAPE